ncbi:MAG: hypothetical protein VW963_01415 [Candidatus Neomarinimicrobiota bacterium]
MSSTSFAQGKWHDGNLKGINDLFFSLNIKGIDDGVWEKRVFSFIELRLLEHGIELIQDQMPRMVIDIQILDSRVEETSTYLVMCSVYNYGVSEKEYYRSMADTLITRKLMTSKVYSQELIGQTSSKKIHKEVEKSINKILTTYLDQWYRDNPLKQF